MIHLTLILNSVRPVCYLSCPIFYFLTEFCPIYLFLTEFCPPFDWILSKKIQFMNSVVFFDWILSEFQKKWLNSVQPSVTSSIFKFIEKDLEEMDYSMCSQLIPLKGIIT